MTHFGIPLLEDLYCINCRVEHSGSILNSTVKSLYHVQILYCRLIIYSIRCCLASPSIQNVGDVIHVIVSKRFFAEGKLQGHLSDLNIKFSDPEPVHSKIYEACLRYTITFKLAPLWNCMGKSWYLYGDNFLSLPYNNDAIEWDIYYKGEETKIGLKPMKVNLFPFNLESVIPVLLLENFKKSSTMTMNLGFESPQVYVLPKLTKGRVVSVSKNLPKTCPFENYDILRRHWKNMYSYRLPKTAEGMLFYEVVFMVNPNQKFTYPDICLFSRKPEFLASDNKNAVASKFLKDLFNCIPRICNEAVKVGHSFPELPVERSGQTIRNLNYPIFPYKDLDTMYTAYSKTPTDEYVVKPLEKKLKMSNLFTFKGIDKMTPHMRDHSQKVLSIMNGQTKKSKASSSSQYKSEISTTSNGGNFSNGPARKLTLANLSSSKRRTEINDTDNICSFYEIPSMYPLKTNDFDKNSNHDAADTDKSNKEPSTQASNAFDFTELSYPSAKSKLKPTIKNIETVSFDLNGIRKIRTVHEVHKGNSEFDESKNLKSKKMKTNEVTSSFFDQKNDHKQPSVTNFSNNAEKENSYRDDNSYKMDVDQQFKKLEDASDVSKENKESGGKELRTLFSKFDSYNIGEEEDQEFENNIYSECNNGPLPFEKGNKNAQDGTTYQDFDDHPSDQETPSLFSMSPIQTSPSMLQRYQSPEVPPRKSPENLKETQNLQPTMEVTVENQSNKFCQAPSNFEVNSRDKNRLCEEWKNRYLPTQTELKKCRKPEPFFKFSRKAEESTLDQSISSNYTYELCGDNLVKKYPQVSQPVSLSSQATVKNLQSPRENNFSDKDDPRYSPSLLDMCQKPTQKWVSFQEKRAKEQSIPNSADESRNSLEGFTNASLNHSRDSRGRSEMDRKTSPTFQCQGPNEVNKVFSPFNINELGTNNPDNSDFMSIITQSTDSESESINQDLKREYDEALTFIDPRYNLN